MSLESLTPPYVIIIGFRDGLGWHEVALKAAGFNRLNTTT